MALSVVNELDNLMKRGYNLVVMTKHPKVRTHVRTSALQAILARRGITQAQLATMLGTSRPSVSRLVNGTHTPNTETRKRLMTVLGLGFDDLFELVREHEAVS